MVLNISSVQPHNKVPQGWPVMNKTIITSNLVGQDLAFVRQTCSSFARNKSCIGEETTAALGAELLEKETTSPIPAPLPITSLTFITCYLYETFLHIDFSVFCRHCLLLLIPTLPDNQSPSHASASRNCVTIHRSSSVITFPFYFKYASHCQISRGQARSGLSVLIPILPASIGSS
jgi:hypothetical protein